MSRTRRYLRNLLVALALCGAFLGLCVLTLRSSWFGDYVRRTIIAEVQNATGAKVDIRSFEFSWNQLTADIRGFTLHGFEPASAPPLFQTPHLQVHLRILSLLERKVQVQSLLVDRPNLNLLIRSDGTTNFPGPALRGSAGQTVQQLLNLRLPHLKIENGYAQINDRRLPLNISGENIALALTYNHRAGNYALTLASPALHFAWSRDHLDGSLETTAVIYSDGVDIKNARVHSGAGDAQLTGTLRHFAAPVLDWRLQAQVNAQPFTRLLSIPGVESGTALIAGFGHSDPLSPFLFQGDLNARELAVSVEHYRFLNARISSNFSATLAGVRLANLAVTTPQGRIAGAATLDAFRELHLTGNISRLAIETLQLLGPKQRLPWSGWLAGPVQLGLTFWPRIRDIQLRTDLDITPAPQGIPISGDAHLTYNQARSTLTFAESHVNFPHSQLIFAGDPRSSSPFTLHSTDLHDLQPALGLLHHGELQSQLPTLEPGGNARVKGTVTKAFSTVPSLLADLTLSRFELRGQSFDTLCSTFSATPTDLTIDKLSLQSPLASLNASGHVASASWRLDGQFANLKLAGAAAPVTGGRASGTFHLAGSPQAPEATAQVTVRDLQIYGQTLQLASATLGLHNNELKVANGELHSGSASLLLAGSYVHNPQSWSAGILQLALDSSAFPLSRLHTLTPALQDIDGQLEIHAKTASTIARGHVAPLFLEGYASGRRLTLRGTTLGSFNAKAITHDKLIDASWTGDLRGANITGLAHLQIAPGTPASGQLHFDNLTLDAARFLAGQTLPAASTLAGIARGELTFNGFLESPAELSILLQIPSLQIRTATPSAPEILLQNEAPVRVQLSNGTASIASLKLVGKDTSLALTGTAALIGARALNLTADGRINLQLIQLLYPGLQTSGVTRLAATVGGSLADPQVSGTLQLVNGAIASPVLPNSLSELNGTIRFDANRATLQKVVARTGGGQISFGGFVTYAPGRPLVYRLEAAGHDVRVRYAGGISVTANSQLSLTGTSEQSLLSGGITVSRVVFNPSTDLGNLLAITSAPSQTVDNQKDYLSRLQMDVHIESAPNLELDTALSSGVQAEIDLELRGTPKQPVFLGSVEANEGDIKVFGSRYSINRGQVSFTNSARIEPVLDLDLQTQARGITVDITISGTLNKLNVNYRSDPPLQPRDIIALLTVGRAPDTTISGGTNVQNTNDASALQSGANTVLGQAISPVSNRLSKLFGITNIKIDPLVQGITNTPQARLTLEQQVSRQITVTYVTNLNQTSEQIFRVEYALSRQFSLVALRDDNGEFGVDFLYKKRFK